MDDYQHLRESADAAAAVEDSYRMTVARRLDEIADSDPLRLRGYRVTPRADEDRREYAARGGGAVPPSPVASHEERLLGCPALFGYCDPWDNAMRHSDARRGYWAGVGVR